MSGTDLFELQRKNLLDLLNISTENNLKYLVVDEYSEHLINSVIDLKTLLRNVTAVERIDSKRKCQTSIEGIYLVQPTKFNLACLNLDLNKIQPPRYKFVHIMLINGISNSSGNGPVKINSPIIKSFRNVNFNFKPLDPLVFTTVFDSSQNSGLPIQKDFSEDHKNKEKYDEDFRKFNDFYNLNDYSMQIWYNPNFRTFVNYQIELVVNNLLNLCILLNEYPIIRFYSPKLSMSQATVVSKLIADKLQFTIDNYLRENSTFTPNLDSNDTRSILLIADRTLDLFDVLLHDFNYEGMIYDYLPNCSSSKKPNPRLKDNTVFNQKNQVLFYESEAANKTKLKKLSKLNTYDKYFDQLRCSHISESYETLNKLIKKLFDDNPLLVDTSNATSVNDIMHIMAHSTEFGEDRRLLTLHKQLIEKFLQMNLDFKLNEISNFEQIILADGYDINNDMIKLQKLTNDLIVILNDMNVSSTLSLNHKLRVVLLYCLKRKDGVIKNDLVEIFKFLNITSNTEIDNYMRLFDNLTLLNHKIIKEDLLSGSHKHGGHHHHKRNELQPLNNPVEYGEIDNTNFNTSRYQPALYKVLNNLIAKNNIELQEFPFINEAENSKLQEEEMLKPSNASTTSLRSTKLQSNWKLESSWSSSRSTSTNNLPLRKRQKIITYMVGGITQHEIKTMDDLNKKYSNKEFIIGSECVLNGNETIDNIINLQNGNLKDMKLYLPLKLQKDNSDQIPDFLFDTGLNTPRQIQRQPAQQMPSAQMQQQKPISLNSGASSGGIQANSLTSSSSGSVKPEKKHKFGKFLKKF